MNNKIIALSLIALTVLSAIPAIALAVPKPVSTYINPKGKVNGPAGKSHITRLYLVEKDSNDDIVSDGGWGKLQYSTKTKNMKYVFNGHDLTVGGDYTLISYTGALPWTGLKCYGNDVADEDGNVHIKGKFTSVPTGEKFALVLTTGVDCEGPETSMTTSTPTEHLLEY